MGSSAGTSLRYVPRPMISPFRDSGHVGTAARHLKYRSRPLRSQRLRQNRRYISLHNTECGLSTVRDDDSLVKDGIELFTSWGKITRRRVSHPSVSETVLASSNPFWCLSRPCCRLQTVKRDISFTRKNENVLSENIIVWKERCEEMEKEMHTERSNAEWDTKKPSTGGSLSCYYKGSDSTEKVQNGRENIVRKMSVAGVPFEFMAYIKHFDHNIPAFAPIFTSQI